jgi:hypothetical protein
MTRKSESELVDIDCKLVHTTDRAYLLDDGKTKDWVPKSRVEVEAKLGRLVVATMPRALAEEKGFI